MTGHFFRNYNFIDFYMLDSAQSDLIAQAGDSLIHSHYDSANNLVSKTGVIARYNRLIPFGTWLYYYGSEQVSDSLTFQNGLLLRERSFNEDGSPSIKMDRIADTLRTIKYNRYTKNNYDLLKSGSDLLYVGWHVTHNLKGWVRDSTYYENSIVRHSSKFRKNGKMYRRYEYDQDGNRVGVFKRNGKPYVEGEGFEQWHLLLLIVALPIIGAL